MYMKMRISYPTWEYVAPEVTIFTVRVRLYLCPFGHVYADVYVISNLGIRRPGSDHFHCKSTVVPKRDIRFSGRTLIWIRLEVIGTMAQL